MRRALAAAAAGLCAALTPIGASHAQVEPSVRLAAWSGDRLSNDDGPTPNLELWGRGRAAVGDGVSVHAEAFIATDPVGDADAGGDVRDAYVRWRGDNLELRAGRQIVAWGRADRINPTDVAAARDYRRLVVDDPENRRGLALLSARAKIDAIAITGFWFPEFRASELPQAPLAPGLAERRAEPTDAAAQGALRIERLGRAVDWSITAARVFDRTPWLTLASGPDAPVLVLRHPSLTMLGADTAFTLGRFGLRAEAAVYDYDLASVAPFVRRTPRAASTLGIDRSFAGDWNVLAQAVVHASSTHAPTGPTTPGVAALRDRNATLHRAWRDTVSGGSLRVAKGFAAARGAAEVSVASYSGGGAFVQAKASYAVRDGVRGFLLAESFSGPSDGFFGRLTDNDVVAVGVRKGF